MEIETSKSHWLICPVCHNKTRVKVDADTCLVNFPLFCSRCRKEKRVDVVQFKMVRSRHEGS